MRNSKKQDKRPMKSKSEDLIRNYRVNEPTTLLEFISSVLKDKSRTAIKSLLKYKHFAINGSPNTQFYAPLNPNDEVSVNFDRPFRVCKSKKIRILFEDDLLIVVDKMVGLLYIGPVRE